MESLLNKYNSNSSSIHSRIRSGSNKENQAPTGGNLRAFKNHHSAGPIGMPFKPKNANSLHFHSGMNNLLRNQTNQHHFDKIHSNNNLNNNSLNINLNNPNANFMRKTNISYQSDEGGLNPLQSSFNGMRGSHLNQMNSLSLSINSNLSTHSNSHKLSDLYRPHLSGSTSSLHSYSSNENSIREDKRFLPPPPKQNIMYHEQRYKTELCRAYEEQNNCVYGDGCMFAHGLWELKKPMNRHPKYKTQKCVAFEEQGLCMFGSRCSFLHEKIGSAEEIVESMLKLNKQTFPMPENPNKTPDPEQLTRLETVDEKEFLTKSIDGMKKRAEFLTTLKSENLFDWTTSKPVFNFHPRSTNSAYENIVRLETLSEHLDKNKDKLLPDLTSLLVDDQADSTALCFNDGANDSTRLPIFERISSSSDLKMSASELNLMDALNCSNNSSKSSCSKSSMSSIDSEATLTASSIMSLSSSGSSIGDLKSMDFEFERYFV